MIFKKLKTEIMYYLEIIIILLKYFQFSSVAQSCPTLCGPMDRSTPGLPVHHQLPESTQTHVHRVSDAIQPSIVPSIRVFSNESALQYTVKICVDI